VGKHIVARVTATVAPLGSGLATSTDAYTPSRGAILEDEALRMTSGQSKWGANFLRMNIE
jgi:hypothetical protein